MSLDLIIVTPEGESFSDAVDSVVLPGIEGEFEVLESHESYLVQLEPGAVEIKVNAASEFAAISGGFANVTGAKVTVLADACELAESIDLSRAERSNERAQRAMEMAELGSDLFKEEQLAVQRAAVRVAVASRR